MHFVSLVAEILHRLVIDQAVDGARIGLGIHFVHGAAEHHAPFGDHQREGDVDHERGKGDDGEPRVVFDEQNRRHQADFQQRRQDVEQQESEQETDAARAALDVARYAAGLPLQMEAQTQTVQMLEHLQCHAADGALRHLGEQRIAQFAEQRAEQTQQTVADHQEHRDGQHRLRLAHRIHDLLEHQRHGHVGELRQHQKHDHRNHPDFELQQIGQQTADDAPIGAGLGGRSVRIGIHLGIAKISRWHYSLPLSILPEKNGHPRGCPKQEEKHESGRQGKPRNRSHLYISKRHANLVGR